MMVVDVNKDSVEAAKNAGNSVLKIHKLCSNKNKDIFCPLNSEKQTTPTQTNKEGTDFCV